MMAYVNALNCSQALLGMVANSYPLDPVIPPTKERVKRRGVPVEVASVSI